MCSQFGLTGQGGDGAQHRYRLASLAQRSGDAGGDFGEMRVHLGGERVGIGRQVFGPAALRVTPGQI